MHTRIKRMWGGMGRMARLMLGVDDDAMIVYLLETALEDEGY